MSAQKNGRVTLSGSYPHKLTTRVGTLTLRIPRLRNGKFSTEMFARYQRSEQALVLAMMEMVINGVSTRKISLVTEELCGAQFSKSTVSELCKNLDPVVESWNHRPLKERYPFVVVDAMVTKVREEGRVRARGLLIAFGVNMQGLPFWDSGLVTASLRPSGASFLPTSSTEA
jgi:putative transposase